jgi:anti-sigma regulatory factor (Ser/Thr protein kinase)
MNSDPLEVHCYANLIANFLYNCNKLTVEQKAGLTISLVEMLMNAIEHGNCGITYDEKSAWLESGNYIHELIDQKCRDPIVAQRKVTFEYALGSTSSRFLIADEGDGFDWRKVRDVTTKENCMELHGRGILVAKLFTKNLVYNDKGNTVTFEIGYEESGGGAAPGIFKDRETLEVAPGDLIFRQGEPSNFLYYIVKGGYDVVVDDTTVSSLTPDDIFMGEMSFLLNNQRSASVRARTEGRLIKISKREFVEAIRERPHYALVLCRLLAQRIERSNRLSAVKQAIPATARLL